MNRFRLALAPVLLFALSCRDAGPPAPTAMEVVGAAKSLNSVVGTVVDQSPKLKVTDADGKPVAGVTMNFVAGGGGTLASPTAVSDADGIVTAPAWTLGPVTGINTLTAFIHGLTGSPKLFVIGTISGAPANMTITSGDNQTGTAGTFLPSAPVVRLADAFDNPVSNATIAFTVVAGGGTLSQNSVTTNSVGVATVTSWRLGPKPGTNTVTAALSTGSLSVTFNAIGQRGPASVSLVRGTSQIAMAGNSVDELPVVLVRDGEGLPLDGVAVTFAIASGGGSITGAARTTAADGTAALGGWTLGATPGLNTVTATVAGAGIVSNPVTFNASGCGGGGVDFKLTLCFTSAMTAGQRAAFTSAAARWESLITSDLGDEVITSSLAAGTCGSASFRMPQNTVIDDLLIFAAVVPIDGPGAVLGSAGPCLIRDVGNLSVVGTMRFDAADVVNLESAGNLNSVILHEMGHVLGIGTLWSTFGLLVDRSFSGGASFDTRFVGANAIEAFNAIGGATYTGGLKVPVENNPAFGPGTVNGHWRESVLQNELMTGFINSSTSNPLSVLTVRSLQDLGYTVNVGGADAFFLTLSISDSPGATKLQMIDDVYMGPMFRMDRLGRMIRIR